VETISYLESLGYSNVALIYNGIRQRAQDVGITIGPVPRKYNTHLSLLLTEYAKEQNKLLEYNQAVFRAFWADSRDISDPAVLEQIMAVIGLDFNAGLPGVKSGEYERRFEDAKALSRKLQITAVPAFIIDDKYLISGAQPVEVFRQVLMGTSSPPGGSGPADSTDS
jgi:predicted DsbA family dithiol-disulfide isomerase